MATKRWAIQRVFDMRIKELSSGKLKALIEDLESCNLEADQENVYSSGGAGNAYITAHSHSKRLTGDVTAATFYNNVIDLVTGTDTVTGDTTYPWTEVLTVESNISETTYTAVGTENAEIESAYIYNDDGSFGDELTQVESTPTSDEFTYNSETKEIEFDSEELEDDTKIIVSYNVSTGETAETITSNVNEFSKIVKVELVSLVQDVCDATEYPATIVVPKAKLTGSFTMETAKDADPASFSVSFESLKASCTSDKLWEMIIVDTNDFS